MRSRIQGRVFRTQRGIGMFEDGFTLIEIIIAIAVLSILAGAMAPMVSQRVNAAREETTHLKMRTLREALLAYAKDTGDFPKSGKNAVASLSALENAGRKTPPGWRGPYIVGARTSQDYARDAWNAPYLYRVEQSRKNGPKQVVLTSTGPDRHLGGRDDISMKMLMPMEGTSDLIEKSKETLKLIAGDIYGRAPSGAPKGYQPPKQWRKDAWGNAVRYKMYNSFSAVVYSMGPNGIDNKLAKDDLFHALVWNPASGALSGKKDDDCKKGKKKNKCK